MHLKRLVVAFVAPLLFIATASADELWTLGVSSDDRAQGVTAARVVQPRLDRLQRVNPGDEVSIPLSDAVSLAVAVTGVDELGLDRRVIAGMVSGVETSSVRIAIHHEGIAGSIRLGDGAVYRVRGTHTGRIQLESIDDTKLPWCDMADDGGGLDPATVQSSGYVNEVAGLGCDDGSIIDVLIPYSSQARIAAGGTSNLLAELDLLIADMNDALAFSQAATQMRLVHAREFPGTNGISLSSLTNDGDGIADGVHDLRDAYAADQVAFVGSGGGGVANGLWQFDPSFADTAFCINGRDSVPFIIAHEIGHNLGCCHARGDGGGCPGEGGLLYPYSNGHRFNGNSGTLWRSVMAYSPGNWTGFYSNPTVLFDGQPTGISEDSEESADNAKTINLAAPLVATWRCSDTTCMDLDLPPDAPDCNGNDIPDLCEIALGDLEDANGDGIPDICQCIGDLDDSGGVNVSDLLTLLSAWGPCVDCIADLDGDDEVTVSDLLLLLAAWGPCP